MRKQNWVLDMSRDIYHGRTVKEAKWNPQSKSSLHPTQCFHCEPIPWKCSAETPQLRLLCLKRWSCKNPTLSQTYKCWLEKFTPAPSDVLNRKIGSEINEMHYKVPTVLFVSARSNPSCLWPKKNKKCRAIHRVWGPTKWAGEFVIRSLALETPFPLGAIALQSIHTDSSPPRALAALS